MSTILDSYHWLENELHSLIGPVKFSSEINLRLERMAHLLDLIDNPHHKFRSIHVGGTSGKGSTSQMIASILHKAGYKVGLHTKPHVQILNERHQINGKFVSTSKLVELYRQMKPAIEAVGQSSPFGAPSYFEAQIALTFLLFAQEKVDMAVIEVGLGGFRDATNVLPADVSVITNVGLDHTEILGDTVEEIAQDKAGIIKAGQTVITGVNQPSVFRILSKRSREVGAELQMLGLDFDVIADGHYIITCGGEEIDDVYFGMPGRFQAKNGAVAVAAVRAFEGITVSQDAIREGLATATLPARVETVQQAPLVLLDGAHNPDKIEGAADLVQELGEQKRVITVLGIKSGKTAADMLPFVLAASDKLILTAFEPKGLWAAEKPEKLAALVAEIEPSFDKEVIHGSLDALQAALDQAEPADIIWITGSLYLAGELRSHWYPIEQLLNRLERDESGT